MIQELLLTTRSFRKSPVPIAATVICLALGIAASVAVFSAIDALLLRPLPYQDADRLVNIFAQNTKEGWDRMPTSTPDFLTFREFNQSFENLVAFRFWFHTIGSSTESEHVHGFRVSPGFFDLLGANLILAASFN